MAMVLKTKQTNLEFIPEGQKDEAEPFTILYKPLTATEKASLEDTRTEITQEQSFRLLLGTYNLKMLKYSITGWKNVVDEKGESIAIPRGRDGLITDEVIDCLSIKDRQDLIRQIEKASNSEN